MAPGTVRILDLNARREIMRGISLDLAHQFIKRTRQHDPQARFDLRSSS